MFYPSPSLHRASTSNDGHFMASGLTHYITYMHDFNYLYTYSRGGGRSLELGGRVAIMYARYACAICHRAIKEVGLLLSVRRVL